MAITVSFRNKNLSLIARSFLSKFRNRYRINKVYGLIFVLVLTVILYNSPASKELQLEWSLNTLNLQDLYKDDNAIKMAYPGVEYYTQYTKHRLGLISLSNVTPIDNNMGDVINDVNFLYIREIQQVVCKKEIELLVVIISSPGNSFLRKLLRRTWINQLAVHEITPNVIESGRNVSLISKCVFLIGKTNDTATNFEIEREKQLHKDIIQVNLFDSYLNLTLKSTAMLHWAFTYCQQANFILKIDDDMYLNTKKMESFLEYIRDKGFASMPAVFGKQLPLHNAPVREKNEKSFVSYDMWPWATYPPYVYGGIYLITKSAVIKLLAAAQTTPYIHFEDLFLIGLCASKARVPVMVTDRFFAPRFTEDSDLIDKCLPGFSLAWEPTSATQFVNSHIITDNYFETLVRSPECNNLENVFLGKYKLTQLI